MTMPEPAFDLPSRRPPGRTRSSPLHAVPPRPPTRNRSSNESEMFEYNKSSKENGSNHGSSITMSSPRQSLKGTISTGITGGGGSRISSSAHSSSSSATPRASSSATPRRNMSNRQRMAQMAVQELSASMSQMNVPLDLGESFSSLISSEGSYSLNDVNKRSNDDNNKDNNNSNNSEPSSRRSSGRSNGQSRAHSGERSSRKDRAEARRQNRRRDGSQEDPASSRHRRSSDNRRSRDNSVDKNESGESGELSCSSSSGNNDLKSPRSSGGSDRRSHHHRSSSNGRYSSNKEGSCRSSKHRRTVDRLLDSSTNEGCDELAENPAANNKPSSSSSSSRGGDRGRSRRSRDDRRPRSSSRERKRGGSGGKRSRSRSKNRSGGPKRSQSLNAKKVLRGKPQRNRSGDWKNAIKSTQQSSADDVNADTSNDHEQDPYLEVYEEFETEVKGGGEGGGGGGNGGAGGGIDSSSSTNRSGKISENEILDFLSSPKPTRRLGDRNSSSGEKDERPKRRGSQGALSSGDRGDRGGRRERRERRERERRDGAEGRSSPQKRDRSPRHHGSRDRSPSPSSQGAYDSPKKRSSSADAMHRTPRRNTPRTKSNESTGSGASLEGFLNLSSRRSTRAGSASQSVVSSPSKIMKNSSRRRRSVADSNHTTGGGGGSRPASNRSASSNSSNTNSSGDEFFEVSNESSENSNEDENTQQQQSMRGLNSKKPPRRSSSAEELPSAPLRLPPTPGGTSKSNDGTSAGKRNTPRRSKSSGSKAGLEAFLADAQDGRRRPPAGSGSRSVSSSPAGVIMGKTRKMKQLEEINGRLENGKSKSNNKNYADGGGSGKQSSSRSTLTTENPSCDDMDSDLEYDSEPEALNHKSFREIEKERQIQHHMNRTDDLLYSVFPKHIAESLRAGKKVEPENHDCVTIFFSDIVGFTDISSTLDPLKISDLLDRLYNSFDTLSHYHDVFKVETIGDAYMAVTNLTKDQPDHCKRIAMFAADAIRVANQTAIDVDNPDKGNVNIRVGFHSGPVVSSVVGSRNPRYCLFGDTVNTASRMESNSEVNRIHCSEDAAKILKARHPEIRLASRGAINVKGKGKMTTFWVDEDESPKTAVSGSNNNNFSKSVFNFFDKTKTRNKS